MTPEYRHELLLAGGGHSHALLLAMWAMNPIPGLRVSLISPQPVAPYSGMLPGLIAGDYSVDDIHIDLPALCHAAGARFVHGRVCGLDPEARELQLDGRPALPYDLLSINTGIVPDASIPGAEHHAIPVKPIAEFWPRWSALLNTLKSSTASTRIAVVGGGAAGVELILAMDAALSKQSIRDRVELHLVQSGHGLPEGYPDALQKRMAQRFEQRRIYKHDNFKVSEVASDSLKGTRGKHDYTLSCDHIFWCTGGAPATWPLASGIATNEGFIRVNAALQSPSHPEIFAAGDIARIDTMDLPRAGVFAVRQAACLAQNLRAVIHGDRLRQFRPQKSWLSLLSCADGSAEGCRINSRLPSVYGAWTWRWKDRIDRQFMLQFQSLPPSPMPVPQAPATPASAMRCGGCGAKVSPDILKDVLRDLPLAPQGGILLGLEAGDDAAAFTVPAGQALVQSVDVFRSLLDDPWLLGRIAAQHALNDLFAMNATPHSALAILSLPHASALITRSDLNQIMRGACQEFERHGCALIGGHTAESAELSVGFTVNGLIPINALPAQAWPDSELSLILTKPLGTGVLFAARQYGKVKGEWLEAAINSMCQSNAGAAKLLNASVLKGCTDITGFGLAGHLQQLIKHSGHAAVIHSAALPLIPGTAECLREGIESTLAPGNRHSFQAEIDPEIPLWLQSLLFDPQTAGGLLAAVDTAVAAGLVQALEQAGYSAVIVGSTHPAGAGESQLRVEQ